MAGRVFAESDGAKPAGLHRMARIVEVDGVHAARSESLWKVDEDRSCIALVLESNSTEKYLVDVERGMQIELDAPAVLEHPEADGVLALKELLLRVDAHIEVIKQQVVIGAIRSVPTAQNVGSRRPVRGNHGCGECQEQGETTERDEFQMRTTVQPRVIYRPGLGRARPQGAARTID